MLNIIRDNLGARKKFKAVGRGIGLGKGKTSGRGGKGQTARSGVAINGFEGGQTSLLRRLPKRGFNSYNKEVYEVINFDDIEYYIEKKVFSKKITLNDLRVSGLLKGLTKKIKLLGNGNLKSKFEIEVHSVSKSAMKNLEEKGCTVNLITNIAKQEVEVSPKTDKKVKEKSAK